MERQRKYKIFSIVALVLAIAGMTLGFAAFSKVLTITASATVTPNEEDFKVVTYGIKDEDSFNSFDGSYEVLDEYLSSEISVGCSFNNDIATGTEATITNDKNSTTISDINVTLDKEQSAFHYYFIIKNEGKYDAYIDLQKFDQYTWYTSDNGVCTAVDETNANQDEINTACQSISIETIGYMPDGSYIGDLSEEPYYKLAVDDYIYIDIQIWSGRNGIILDPYTVDFEDITINFSTAPQK